MAMFATCLAPSHELTLVRSRDLSMLGLKLNHVSKRGPWAKQLNKGTFPTVICQVSLYGSNAELLSGGKGQMWTMPQGMIASPPTHDINGECCIIVWSRIAVGRLNWNWKYLTIWSLERKTLFVVNNVHVDGDILTLGSKCLWNLNKSFFYKFSFE